MSNAPATTVDRFLSHAAAEPTSSLASLQRACGTALLVAGPVTGLAMMAHPDEFVAGALLDPLWRPVHLALLLGFLLSVPGVLGVHLVQRHRSGRLGAWGFALAFVGSVLSVALVVVEALVLPAIAAAGPPRPMMELIQPSADLGGVGVLFMIGVPIWIAGYLMMGIAVARAGVLPRRAGLLLSVATLLTTVPIHFLAGAGPVLHVISGVSFGGAWCWLGLAVLRASSTGETR